MVISRSFREFRFLWDWMALEKTEGDFMVSHLCLRARAAEGRTLKFEVRRSEMKVWASVEMSFHSSLLNSNLHLRMASLTYGGASPSKGSFPTNN